jgi:hypothetical protein
VHHRPRRRTASSCPLTTVFTCVTDPVGTNPHTNPSVPSDAEGEKTVPVQIPVPPPTGETVEDAVDETLTDPEDVEDDGTAAPSNAHGGEQTTDGKEAPDFVCLPRYPPGVLNLGGDPPRALSRRGRSRTSRASHGMCLALIEISQDLPPSGVMPNSGPCWVPPRRPSTKTR